jgi:hypothetical protein
MSDVPDIALAGDDFANRTMTWQERLRRYEQYLVWPGWGGLALTLLLLVLNPALPDVLLILLAVLELAAIAGCTAILAWCYRRRLGNWWALMVLWGVVATTNAWPLIGQGTSESGTYAFAIVASSFVLWWVLLGMMVRHDAGLALGISVVIAVAWSLAVVNVALRGPENVLLMLLTEGDTGRIWWFNTLIIGLMCIAPIAPFTFGGWLLFRLYREFLGRGSI